MLLVIKRLLFGTIATLVIGAGAVVYLAVPYFSTPKFVVRNESGVSVEVTAHWKGQSRNLGSLSVGSERVFEVNDEAAMEFRAVYPSGQIITSEPGVYFTSGTTVIAVVTGSSIEVSTEF